MPKEITVTINGALIHTMFPISITDSGDVTLMVQYSMGHVDERSLFTSYDGLVDPHQAMPGHPMQHVRAKHMTVTIPAKFTMPEALQRVLDAVAKDGGLDLKHGDRVLP